MGDRGRLVVPAELRERAGLHEGRPVVLVEAPQGLLLLTREQLRDLVRSGLEGKGLLEHLLADRRAAASAEDIA
jgi:bifunctional DNA-binding transcriptional regulator/antitoxin component of YhaV-PrlF toxin-antitoxin module